MSDVARTMTTKSRGQDVALIRPGRPVHLECPRAPMYSDLHEKHATYFLSTHRRKLKFSELITNRCILGAKSSSLQPTRQSSASIRFGLFLLCTRQLQCFPQNKATHRRTQLNISFHSDKMGNRHSSGSEVVGKTVFTHFQQKHDVGELQSILHQLGGECPTSSTKQQQGGALPLKLMRQRFCATGSPMKVTVMENFYIFINCWCV